MTSAAEHEGAAPPLTRVVLRDRAVADVLDLTLRFIVAEGGMYAKVALGSLVPLAAISLLAGAWLGGSAVWVVAIPLAFVAEIPFTVLGARLVVSERVAARTIVRTALRAAPRLIVMRAAALALVATGLFALLLPGVWLAGLTFFLGEVTLLEGGSRLQSFGRAQRLCSSAVSEVILGRLLLWLVPIGAVLLADVTGRAMLNLLQFSPPKPVWTSGGSAFATLGLFAQIPYYATARFFLYLNVRTRTEGWDIQTRFSAIARRAEERHGTP